LGGFLDSWVVYGSQTKTKTTNKRLGSMEKEGSFRNIWENVGKSMNFVEVLIYVNIKIIMMMTPG
jgi:hypothetical protein